MHIKKETLQRASLFPVLLQYYTSHEADVRPPTTPNENYQS